MAYVHEGYKASNQGRGMLGGQSDLGYAVSKMDKRDFIYTQKTRAEGLKELKE